MVMIYSSAAIALNKVYEKANSVRTAVVKAPVWIHKYIIGRKGVNIKRITQEMPKVNVEFTGKEDKIKIEGPPEEVEKAQNELELMASDLISKLTFTELNVDPRFYKYIIGKNGCNGELEFTLKLLKVVRLNTLHARRTRGNFFSSESRERRNRCCH